MLLPTYPKRPTNAFTLAIALAAMLLAAPLNAVADPSGQAGPDQTAKEVAAGQLSGTTLTVTPRIGYYETAVLRVSGPAHYTLTKRFEANAPISAELLSEGDSRADGREHAPSPLETLPSGHYNYEVVFDNGSGERPAHAGSFQIP